jgi:hypothetical protein
MPKRVWSSISLPVKGIYSFSFPEMESSRSFPLDGLESGTEFGGSRGSHFSPSPSSLYS